MISCVILYLSEHTYGIYLAYRIIMDDVNVIRLGRPMTTNGDMNQHFKYNIYRIINQRWYIYRVYIRTHANMHTNRDNIYIYKRDDVDDDAWWWQSKAAF